MVEDARFLYYGSVREDILNLVRGSGLSSSFTEAIEMGLAADGKVLSSHPRSRWPLMVILPCVGAGGHWADSLPLATAAELVGIASDVFDEIEDGDECPLARAVGIPRATNVASALLVLAGQSLFRAPPLIGQGVWRAILAAADGQHQDLGRCQIETPEEYLAAIDRKSAVLVAAFCTAGARIAGATQEAVDGFARFGLHVGRWAQLLNDLHDVWPGGRGKSDLARRLITLPAIFVLRGPDSPHRAILERWLANGGAPSTVEESSVRNALWDGGGVHYTWLIAETNREAAEAALRSVCTDNADTIVNTLLPPTPPVEEFLAAASP